MLSRLKMALWTLLHRAQSERELDDELRHHIEQQTEQNIRLGMSPGEARYAARKAFVGVEQAKERSRDLRGVRWLEELWLDLRYGGRMLVKNPGFTAVALLSLALGIGANTAIFSVIDALLLKRLPVERPEQLFTIAAYYPGEGGNRSGFVYQTFEQLRDHTQVFSGLSAVCLLDRYNITVNVPLGNIEAGPTRVELVSGNYFSTLGVRAVVGRTFIADDDRAPGAQPVAVLSYDFWKRRLGLADGVVGSTLTLNSQTYVVVGVAPARFTGEWVGKPTDIWVPMAMQSQVMPEQPGLLTMPNSPTWARIIARTRPDVTVEQAQSGAQAIFDHWLADTFSPTALQQMGRVQLLLDPAGEGYSPERVFLARPMLIMLALVALVLLIACANVATLLLQRATRRWREIALRLAIGATPARIVRQLLVESALLAILGGVAGLLLSKWGMNAFARLIASGNHPLTLDLGLEERSLVFTSVLCLLTGLLFGLIPALHAARISLMPVLKGRGADKAFASGRFRLGKALVVVQVALSLVLLVGAGLFERTFRNLQAEDYGFDREHTLLVRAAINQPGRQGAALARLYQNVQDRLSLKPGVLAASPSHGGISPTGFMNGVFRDSAIRQVGDRMIEPGAEQRALWYVVAPGFFDSMGMRLTAGRDFTAHDTEATQRVAVINEVMARHYFGNENPVGRRFGLKRDLTFEVVGVVKAEKYNSPRDENRFIFFLPYAQDPNARSTRDEMLLAVRIQGRPADWAERIRKELRHIDASLPLISVTTMEEELGRALALERLIAALAGGFGLLALLLACLGVGCVASYDVARRTQEIGIRMALGAGAKDVTRLMLGETATLVLMGVAIGMGVALAATRFVASLLYGLTTDDPLTLSLAVTLLLAVTALAVYLPARRAARVDPIVALRHE